MRGRDMLRAKARLDRKFEKKTTELIRELRALQFQYATLLDIIQAEHTASKRLAKVKARTADSALAKTRGDKS